MSRRRMKRELHRQQSRRRVGRRCGQTGKCRYPSEGAALHAVECVLQRPDCNAAGFRIYRCEFCNGYHLTSKV